MAPSILLPPLNPKGEYKIYVEASQSIPAKFDESLVSAQFLIKRHLSVKFISDSKYSYENRLEILSVEDESFVTCHEISNSTSIDSLELIANMLYRDRLVPFEIDRVIWTESHLYRARNDIAKSCCNVLNKRDFLEKIRGFLCGMMLKEHNADKNILPLKLEIEKLVILPDEELKAWNSWFNENKIRYPDFERYFREAIIWAAIIKPQIEDELMHEEDDIIGDSSSCSICLEELQKGSEFVTGLPCSHLFHEDCINKWLQCSLRCPLCRFVLTMDSLA